MLALIAHDGLCALAIGKKRRIGNIALELATKRSRLVQFENKSIVTLLLRGIASPGDSASAKIPVS